MNFNELHQQNIPFVPANVWEVSSAQLAEQLQMQAIGTSSAAIANLFGSPDGEKTPFSTIQMMAGHILPPTQLPIHVMCMPFLPNFETLTNLGVKRISMRNFFFEHMNHYLKLWKEQLLTEHSFNSLF